MSQLVSFLIAAFLISLIALECLAETRHVPAEYPTIQSALDATSDFDTVLVASGTYEEAPVIPALAALWVRGESAGQRPVIDPTRLIRSDTLACMTVSGESTVIENFIFRNGAVMHINREYDKPGGLKVNTQSPFFVNRCLFDSVVYSVGPPGRPVLNECVFQQCKRRCINNLDMPLVATDCVFSTEGFIVTYFGDSSQIVRCTFRDGHGSDWQFSARGTGMAIRDCMFGPAGPFAIASPFNITCTGTFRLEGNVFTENDSPPFGVNSLLNISSNGSDTVYIRGNRCYENSNATVFNLSCALDSFGHRSRFAGLIEGNVFENSSNEQNTPGFHVNGVTRMRRNDFRQLIAPPGVAAVVIFTDSTAEAATIMRENIFIGTGRAVQSSEHIDARWNYWGDLTGPFNALFNPGGQGDAVGDCVNFSPWYPDTNFVAAPEPRSIRPDSYSLTAYPNPFNSTATILLQVPEPSIVRVELFDILGRGVRELWNGPVAYEKELIFRAADLASGIYFVRAYQAPYQKALALTKLVLLK